MYNNESFTKMKWIGTPKNQYKNGKALVLFFIFFKN